jgi:hypothetical protein
MTGWSIAPRSPQTLGFRSARTASLAMAWSSVFTTWFPLTSRRSFTGSSRTAWRNPDMSVLMVAQGDEMRQDQSTYSTVNRCNEAMNKFSTSSPVRVPLSINTRTKSWIMRQLVFS